MAGSDCLCRSTTGYGSSPSRGGPANFCRPDTSSPTFRGDPYVRDEVFDHGRATAPRMTALLMLPSAMSTASASAIIVLSRLNSSPRNDCCVRFATVVTFRPATLATNRTLLPHWTGLPPAGSRQLSVAHGHELHFQQIDRTCGSRPEIFRRTARDTLVPAPRPIDSTKNSPY